MRYEVDVKSNLLLKSNIMHKSNTKEHNWLQYAPIDLLIKLQPVYLDSRTEKFLTKEQREQKLKGLFVAEQIIDID